MIELSLRQKNILKFIVSFINEKKYPPTIREIGEKVGISSTSVVNYNLAKLENEALISRDRDISRGVSINWEQLTTTGLADELGAMPPRSPLWTNNNRLSRLSVKVPILGYIAAGEPIRVDAIEPANATEFIELTQGILGSSDKLFALRVRGESMIDASVLDGDVVILRHQETANDGEMVAAWIEEDEETTLKYLYREGKNIRLQPANPNPAYKPIIRPAEKVRINGKVVSVVRVLPS